MALTIYGVPLSQPVRAVIWPCLIKGVPFKFQLAVPGMAKGPGTGAEKFLAKFPLGTVPAMEDGEVCLAEAGAILSYLGAKHQWSDLYPSDPCRRAKIDEYLHWHHSNTRQIALPYFAAAVRPDMKLSAEAIEDGKAKAQKALETVEGTFLKSGDFLVGSPSPTVADFLAYEEISQVSSAFCATMDLSGYPQTEQWLASMRQLPFHDEVHAALATLGPLDLSEGGAAKAAKKLGPATKAGLEAIAKAQAASAGEA